MKKKNIILILVIVAILSVIGWIESQKPQMVATAPGSDDIPIPALSGNSTTTSATNVASSPTSTTNSATSQSRTALIQTKAQEYQRAKEIVDPTGFINTGPGNPPISIAQYIGKDVILIDFWTYSCVNCQRVIPYLNAWYSTYKGDGFVIIGVHTPEFDFEKDINNVQTAVQKFNIKYPVVLDSNYGTWNAYGNLYWPREYLIDIDGFIRDNHIGEGGYDDTETMIQQLLKERAAELGTQVSLSSALVADSVVNTNGALAGGAQPSSGITSGASAESESPETYFGAFRNNSFGNGTNSQTGVSTYALPTTFQPDMFYLGGQWDIEQQYAESGTTTGGEDIVFPFTAKEVYIVASAATPTPVQVFVDGQAGVSPGSDVVTQNGESTVTISTSRLYSLVNASASGSHTLRLHIPAGGVEIFTLTFGM